MIIIFTTYRKKTIGVWWCDLRKLLLMDGEMGFALFIHPKGWKMPKYFMLSWAQILFGNELWYYPCGYLYKIFVNWDVMFSCLLPVVRYTIALIIFITLHTLSFSPSNLTHVLLSMESCKALKIITELCNNLSLDLTCGEDIMVNIDNVFNKTLKVFMVGFL